MRSAGRDELERVGRRLLVHSERVVEHASEVRACGDLIAKSVLEITSTAEPGEVRERAEAVRAGVVRAVLLLIEVNAESGAMLGLAQAAEVLKDEHNGASPHDAETSKGTPGRAAADGVVAAPARRSRSARRDA